MIWVNGKKVEQDHIAAGELKIKLWPSNRSRIDLVCHMKMMLSFLQQHVLENIMLHRIVFCICLICLRLVWTELRTPKMYLL